jgi:hypothetical protein
MTPVSGRLWLFLRLFRLWRKPHPTAQKTEFTGFSIGFGILVVKHSLGKAAIVTALHFDMNEQPLLFPIPLPNFEQLVGQPFAYLGSFNDLLEFLVQRLVALLPIQVSMNSREEKGQE